MTMHMTMYMTMHMTMSMPMFMYLLAQLLLCLALGRRQAALQRGRGGRCEEVVPRVEDEHLEEHALVLNELASHAL